MHKCEILNFKMYGLKYILKNKMEITFLCLIQVCTECTM